MSELKYDRRRLLAGAALAAGGSIGWPRRSCAGAPQAEAPAVAFAYCLNTSTVRGQELGLEAEIDLAADVGYDAIEPWIGEIDRYIGSGGRLSDLRKRIDDRGLRVADAIGFAQWIVDDPAARAKGLDEARRSMDLVRSLGGTRIAAPPAGATQSDPLPLPVIAERYRALVELGEGVGVVPQLEVWGFSTNLRQLADVAYVAIAADHPSCRLLPDVYHLYKGGSGFEGLRLVGGRAIDVIHINDYPAEPARDAISDADRIYPGDGVAPLTSILQQLRDGGFRGMLSLELFNRSYWQEDAVRVARTGLQKMRATVAALDS